MNRVITILLFLFFYTLLPAQREGFREAVNEPVPAGTVTKVKSKDKQKGYADKFVTPEAIKSHLEILASDKMEGRETGTKGQILAEKYLVSSIKEMGFEPSVGKGYTQGISFVKERFTEKVELSVRGKEFRYMWDYFALPFNNKNMPVFEEDQVVFVGYGIDDEKYSDYKGVDVKGKTIMVLPGEPMDAKGNSKITGSEKLSDWSDGPDKKWITAGEKGAKCIIFMETNIRETATPYLDRLLRGSMEMADSRPAREEMPQSIHVSTEVAKEIIGKKRYKKFVKTRKKMNKKGITRSLVVPTEIKSNFKKETSTLDGSNVLGFLPGSDPKLKDQIVVVSAHYDHLGKRGDGIYNGADDNGSGSSTVLAMANAFAQAAKDGNGPRRSILFIWVSGEEKGLLGSKYYVNHPIYPLENTIADVNVDMIGRSDKNHADNPEYIYVIGADRLSTELHDINEAMNDKYTQIELDYTFNAEDDPNQFYYRSDHYNFAERGIPSIFYFSGVHKDYHRTSDTVEKINFKKTAKIGKLIFHTIWQLANQDKRIEVNVPQKPRPRR